MIILFKLLAVTIYTVLYVLAISFIIGYINIPMLNSNSAILGLIGLLLIPCYIILFIVIIYKYF